MNRPKLLFSQCAFFQGLVMDGRTSGAITATLLSVRLIIDQLSFDWIELPEEDVFFWFQSDFVILQLVVHTSSCSVGNL